MQQQDDDIVFFDGVCNFCCSSVNLIIKNDPRGKFRFVAFQSDYANKLKSNHVFTHDFDANKSIVLLSNGSVLIKSRAVLEIARQLKFPYPIFYMFKIVPVFVADFFYDLIAKNRYRWFGKKTHCMVPDASIRSRFLV